LRSSRNGKFLVIPLRENHDFVLNDKYESPGHRRKGSREDYGSYRLGIVREGSDEIQWVTTIRQKVRFLPKVSQSAVSEDGKYLAAVGTSNGGFIHLADVAQKKVLWEKVPRGEEVPLSNWTVNFSDVCFSPDSKYVYVAANVGLLCFDLPTGKILSQWRMTGLCTVVDVSPDGRLVAGSGEGSVLVYVFHAKTGKVLLKLHTGQLSVCGLTFSPDSTLLATSGVRHTNVKIWKMPSVGSENAPQAPEPNENKL
jgi:WD40 repeat protein